MTRFINSGKEHRDVFTPDSKAQDREEFLKKLLLEIRNESDPVYLKIDITQITDYEEDLRMPCTIT